MNEEFTPINQMRAVTISREYGSGGGEIATRLAKRLGWQLIDHALVERAASEIGTTTQEVEVHDEHVQGRVSQALNSLLYRRWKVHPYLQTSDWEHGHLRFVN